MEQRPKVVIDIVLKCVVLHNMLRIHEGRLERAPNPTDDMAATENEVAVYVLDETHRNSSRQAKEVSNSYFLTFQYLPQGVKSLVV